MLQVHYRYVTGTGTGTVSTVTRGLAGLDQIYKIYTRAGLTAAILLENEGSTDKVIFTDYNPSVLNNLRKNV